MKTRSTEESIESFVQDVLKPYRELSIHLAEQPLYAADFSVNHVEQIDRLVQLKKTALELVCPQDCDLRLSAESDRLNKCIELFIAAIDLQTKMLIQRNGNSLNGPQEDCQQQSQHYLTAMSTQLAALKKDIKKEGIPSN